MARPTLLTKELIADAEKVVARSWCFESASTLLGIDRRTLGRWVREGTRELRRRSQGEGDPSKDLHVELAVTVRMAMVNQAAECLSLIKAAAAGGDWRAAAWILERRWPEDFGRRESEQLVLLKREIDELKQRVRSCDGKADSSQPEQFH
jgi:transposase